MENQDLIDALSEPYYTKEERDWVKQTFKGNQFALKTLRKLFLPTFSHNDPITQVEDIWCEAGQKLGQMHAQDRESTIIAYTKLIEHVKGQIGKIMTLAEVEEEPKNKDPKDGNK